MSNLESPEARIIKKKKVHGGGHGGAWKVAYADFVTAMMALFIVLWIMSQSQSIRLAVAQYFKDPGVLSGSQGVIETSDISGELPTPGHSQELQRPAPAPSEVSQDQARLEEVKKRIQEMIAQMPDLEKLKDQVLLEITDEGLRIELQEMENSFFFDIGSATLKPETKKMLTLIAKELGGLPNTITIEGHTDARPYGSQHYTNWELSADRANAARRFMESAGLRSHQVVTVRGFADRRPMNPQDPLDSRNRRVSIIVNFQDKAKPVAHPLLQQGQGGGLPQGGHGPPSLPGPAEAGSSPPKPAPATDGSPTISGKIAPEAEKPAPLVQEPQDGAPPGPASEALDQQPASLPLSPEVIKKFEDLGLKPRQSERSKSPSSP